MENFLKDIKSLRKIRNKLIFRIFEKSLQYTNTKDKICMVPCGQGWYLDDFFKQDYKLVGGDIDSKRTKISFDKAHKIWNNGYTPSILNVNLKNLPFRDNSFNCIITIRTIGHFPEDFRIACLKEMKRVSKKWILVQYASKYTLKYFYRKVLNSSLLDNKIKPRLLKDHKGKPEEDYRQFKALTGLKKMNKKELAEEAGKAGLKVIKVFSLFPLLSERWYVLLEKIN